MAWLLNERKMSGWEKFVLVQEHTIISQKYKFRKLIKVTGRRFLRKEVSGSA